MDILLASSMVCKTKTIIVFNELILVKFRLKLLIHIFNTLLNFKFLIEGLNNYSITKLLRIHRSFFGTLLFKFIFYVVIKILNLFLCYSRQNTFLARLFFLFFFLQHLLDRINIIKMILNMKGNNLKFYKSEEKIKCSIHNRRENYMHYYYNNIAD